MIYIDYVEKSKTITGFYYAELLGRFDTELQKKRPHLAKKIVLFHDDNALAHTSAVATDKFFELGYELLPLIHRILQIWPRATSFCFQT